MFNSEYLLCCFNLNVLSCNRLNYGYTLIKKFTLYFFGENTFINLVNNNNNFVSIFYKGENNNITYLKEYIIFVPKCSNITKSILNYLDFEIF